MKKLMLFTLIILFSLTTSIAQQASIWDQIPEEKKTNAFKRFEYLYKQIAYPYDTIPMHKYATEIENEIQKIKTQQRQTDSEFDWTFIGPTGVVNPSWLSPHWGVSSGRIRSVAVHPSDPLTVYIGVAYGGIWKTTNGGESWTDIGDYNLEVLTFGSIAIDPNNPDVVYAGTGEIRASAGARQYGKGLFKSTDAGVSWTKATVDLGDITFFGDLVVSPHNSNILYAALGGGYLLINQNQPNEGLWKSTNAGANWIKTKNVQDAYDIIVHPTNPDTVYAATGGWYTTSGFYISADAGDTWSPSNEGLPSPNIGRIQIDIAKSSPNILYAIIYDGLDNTPKAYKTTNSGASWSQISEGVMLSGYGSGGGWYDQGDYDLCIAVNPSDPNHVLIGNVELHETKNGSDFSVKRIPDGNDLWESVVHVDYHHLVFAPSDSNTFFIGCDGGIYKSTDAGHTFLNLNNGISTIEFWRIASHPTNENIILGGAQDNWNSISFNGLVNDWVAVTGGDGMDGFFDYEYPDSIVYASNQNGGLMKSTNGGQSFGTIIEIGGFFLTPFFMHPTDHMTLYSASRHIYRSTDGGTTFPPISYNVVQDNVFSMAQSKVNPNNMILSGVGSFSLPISPEVKISTDGGEHWSNDLSPNIPGEPRWITKVVTHPFDFNTMYIVRSGLSENNKIYKTTDLGNTWTNISGDLPNLPCWDFFVHPYNIEANNVNQLFVGTDIGVYASTNDGVNWQYASEDFPFMPVMDFDFVRYGDICKLRVGTNGRSAYETEWPVLQFPLSVSIEDGWNMVSAPGLHPTNQDVTTWWPNLTGSVFGFSGGYIPVTTTVTGEGYWMKNSGAETYNHTVNIVTHDPIPALTGWNMIGGYENSALVSGLTTNPLGLISGSVFGYAGGYVPATNLVPGYGYWIKLTGDGDIIIPSGPMAKGSVEVVEYIQDDWGKIIITDNAGRSYTLYAINGEVDLNLYDLPPMPPSGIFDIRFGSGRIAEDIKNSIKSIEMSGIEYPLTVKVVNMNVRLQDETGIKINENIMSGEEITISNTSINKLMVSGSGIGEMIPDIYTLKQNYPNPFNPNTTISYNLPKKSQVELVIYNVLGESIKQLINEEKEAGRHSVEFNAITLPSGIYFYRLQAGDFVRVKKMMLLK